MAGELQCDHTSGATVYFMVRSATGTIWNTAGAALEAYNSANIADYDIAATEQGSSGLYVGNMPAAAAGVYNIVAKVRAGGSPAESDVTVGVGEIEWDGSAVAGLAVAIAEQGQGTPAASSSILTRIGYLYKAWRNKTTQTSSEYALYADDGTTKDQEAVVSDDGTTTTRGEVSTGA